MSEEPRPITWRTPLCLALRFGLRWARPFGQSGGELRYATAGSSTVVSGDGSADVAITLHGRHVWNGGDFIL